MRPMRPMRPAIGNLYQTVTLFVVTVYGESLEAACTCLLGLVHTQNGIFIPIIFRKL